MGLNSKNPYKGKIQALEAKLGLFGTIFGPFWDFVVIFTKMKEKTCKKGKKRCHDISHFKIYLTVRKYDRAREYQRHAHDTLCMSK